MAEITKLTHLVISLIKFKKKTNYYDNLLKNNALYDYKWYCDFTACKKISCCVLCIHGIALDILR